jgi:hypothetical protein
LYGDPKTINKKTCACIICVRSLAVWAFNSEKVMSAPALVSHHICARIALLAYSNMSISYYSKPTMELKLQCQKYPLLLQCKGHQHTLKPTKHLNNDTRELKLTSVCLGMPSKLFGPFCFCTSVLYDTKKTL